MAWVVKKKGFFLSGFNPTFEYNYYAKGIRKLASFGMKFFPGRSAPWLASFVCRVYPSEFQFAPCAVCDSSDWEVSHKGNQRLGQWLYPGGRRFPIYAQDIFPLIYHRCKSCGCGRINPTPVRKWVDDLTSYEAEKGEAGWMEDSAYIADKQKSLSVHHQRNQLEQFKVKGTVLDISCGSGVGLAWLRDQFGWKAPSGVECDPQAVAFARENRNLNLKLGLVYDVELESNHYDLVIMDNSLEHHWDPKAALEKVFRCLRPGGGLFIIVPNFHGYSVELVGLAYGNMNWGHWQYFTVQGLKLLLGKCGFRLEKAYSSVLDQEAKQRLKEVPGDVQVEMNASGLDEPVSPHQKVFRGDFIHLLAVKPASS